MELSPRLLKIASLIPKGEKVADVGTDHGYIPLYLFENNIISHAIAMDVNPMPLKRAEDNITAAGFGEKCEFRLSNGLEKLLENEATSVVIAGMGGLLMMDIISRGMPVINKETKLFLQPMIAAPELRLFLFENGFTIENEYVVREENKFYNIICARRGEWKYSNEDIYIGRNTKKNSPEVFDEYIKYKYRVCENIINGIKKGRNPDLNELKKHENQLKIFGRYIK
ncbi:MAG: SAM-dependent methyltransferase [Clostridia bacterium]|nr:SAM-dependent methyltransferase [Clostridia bacterium]MBO7288431.1 SAM-dependent methyltransferase [Clostridia bacterium]